MQSILQVNDVKLLNDLMLNLCSINLYGHLMYNVNAIILLYTYRPIEISK